MRKARSIISLFVVAVIVFCQLTSAVSAGESTASRNNEMAFSIPANTFCDQSQKVELSLNLTNMGSTAATIKLDLLKADGTPFVTPGTSYNGINSTIIPGGSISVNSLVSTFYHQTFGGLAISCAERPFAGKLTVTSADKATLVASGFVSSSLGNTTIIINGGQPWTTTTSTNPTEPSQNPCEQTRVGEDLIPTMTSNISCGIVEASSTRDGVGREAFRAFDDDISSNGYSWHTAAYQTTGWLSYEFLSPQLVNMYTITPQYETSVGLSRTPRDWTFEAWDVSINDWKVLDTRTNVVLDWELGQKSVFSFMNNKSYKKYRINVTKNNGNSEDLTIGEMEMINSTFTSNLIPAMVSNNAPIGAASSSSVFNSSYDAWKAFNHSKNKFSDGWATGNGQINGWLSYSFSTPTKIVKYKIYPYIDNSGPTSAPKTWTFEGWDGASWVTLDSESSVTDWVVNNSKEFSFTNSSFYSMYRINITANNGNPSYSSIGELEMIGKY